MFCLFAQHPLLHHALPCETHCHPTIMKVPWAGEFHGLAHLTDGIVILNWSYVIEPILLHFEVPGFHLKLNMKETSQRIRIDMQMNDRHVDE